VLKIEKDNPDSSKFISAFLFTCIIASIGLIVYISSNPPPGERFTEFYVLGSSGKVAGYPTNLTVGESGTIILGVVNHEYEDVTYRIDIRLENTIIAMVNDVILEHEEKWEQNYTFMPENKGERIKLEFLLYKNGVKETYKSLHLWVTVHSLRVHSSS